MPREANARCAAFVSFDAIPFERPVSHARSYLLVQRPPLNIERWAGLRRGMERLLDHLVDAPVNTYEKRALMWSPFSSAASRWLWDGMNLPN
jgi:hypothetical protein